MDTKIIRVSPADSDLSELAWAGEVLKDGGLVAFPTETVYGLGGDAMNPESSRRIYEAKGRPSDNPLIVHICRSEDLARVASRVPDKAWKAAEAFWPGPLTMIVPKAACIPHETTGGLDTVAVRMPSHRIARKLIELGGGFVAAPSANRSGRPSPTVARYVIEDLLGRVDVIIDGGEVGIGLESTILDLTVEPPQILRPGAITRRMLEEVLGEVAEDVTMFDVHTGQAPKAPGMKYRHYAPKGELVIVEGTPEEVTVFINRMAERDRAAGDKTGVIGTEEALAGYRGDVVKSVGRKSDEESIARRLYTILREFDDEDVTKIYSESFPATGLGQAIMNRLLKAAGHKVVRALESTAERRGAAKEDNMIAIGSDHGGYDLKEQVCRHLQERGIPYRDFGCDSKASVDYPIYGKQVAKAVAGGEVEKGIVICTTGIGISIAANKVRGVRCALCSDTLSARMTRLHNDANVLALGGGMLGPNLALDIVDTFLDTPFSGEEKHQRRVDMLEE